MNAPLSFVMQWTDWFELLMHFFLFSVSSIGGPLVLLPEIHHYLVTQQHWLTSSQFSASVVIAQAALMGLMFCLWRYWVGTSALTQVACLLDSLRRCYAWWACYCLVAR